MLDHPSASFRCFGGKVNSSFPRKILTPVNDFTPYRVDRRVYVNQGILGGFALCPLAVTIIRLHYVQIYRIPYTFDISERIMWNGTELA